MHIAAIAHFLRRSLLAWLLAMPLLAAPAAATGVDPALLAPLTADDTDAKLQAIAALGQLPEPDAAAVLQALGNDQLYATADGRVLIGTGGARATDPVTGAAVDLPSGSGTVTINNRLRRAIEAALAGSACFPTNPANAWMPPAACSRRATPPACPCLRKRWHPKRTKPCAMRC